MRIGILEDDLAVAAQLEDALKAGGHKCFIFNTGHGLKRFLTRETVDLLILDWNVDDVPGVELLRWSKTNIAPHPPTLMLTNRSSPEDILLAFEAGADEYVVKPVDPRVLLARVEALGRLAYPSNSISDIEQYGVFHFHTTSGTLFVRGATVGLTAKEFALTLLLFRNQNRTLSRSYIYDAIWGNKADLKTRTLDVHVSKIRMNAKIIPENGYRLVPIYGYGYRIEYLDGHAS